MSDLFGKIGFVLETYWQGMVGIERQFYAERIAGVQNTKLKRLIHHCFKNTKYYGEIFRRAGIGPGEIKTVQDLSRIPILTKGELRARFWDFLPRQLPKCRVSQTSGSTGVPVCILSDRSSRMFNSAAVIRYRQALGVGFVGGAILTPLKTGNEPYIKKAGWTFLQGIHKTYYVNPYVDSSENGRYARRLLTKIKRPAIIGITPAVKALAYKIRDGDFPAFEPRAILTVGERLTPEVKGLIESTFGTKVSDIYACNEGGDIGWQCPQSGGYHINADNVIVEILKGDEPVADGETGEVVITDLNRYAMPIIRYKNGDLARFKKEACPCGCKLPMIAEIIGRSGEDICLPGGKMMPWNQLKSAMNHPQIRHFQLVQNEDSSFKVKYVAEKEADIKSIEKLLLYRYENLLSSSIAIKIERVRTIRQAPSGKSKLVISHYKGTK